MAAIQFPNNPNAGDLFTASNGIRYTYDGEKWKTLGTSTVGTEGQFLETPTELTIDKVIPGNTNTGAVGSLAIGPGVTLTVPASSSFRTLSGKSGTYGIPETGGTFTGPVSFDDNTIIKGNSTDGSGELTLNCENNSHGIKIKGPPHSAGATYTLILPNDIGTSGQVLTTNGSGVSSWSTIDLSSKLSLTGGTLTGSLTGTTGNFSGSITSTNVAFGFTSNATSFPFTSDSTLGNGGKAFYAKHSNPGGAGSYLFYGENNAGEAFSVTTAGTATFAGNVLINTTTLPTSDSKLTVQSGTHCEVNIIASPSHGSVINMGDTDDYNIGRIKYDNSSNSMQFQTNNSEKMRIDGSGQVGIGISSGISNTLHVFKSGDGQTPVRFETSNSNGKLRFYNDSIGWSLDSEGDLRFTTSRTGSGTPTRMKIDSSGNVGINITNPSAQLHVYDEGGQAVIKTDIINTASQYTYAIQGVFGGGTTFYVLANGNCANTSNSFGAISDAKLKENIVDANSQWDDIKKIRVRNYNLIEGQTHTQIGVVAQEVETVSPGLVNTMPERDSDSNELETSTKVVNYSVLYMKAVKALQEAMDRIETLEQRLSDAGIA